MALSPDKLTGMLITAILKNDAGGIPSLLSMGADPNRSDPKGNSPLTIAATDPREHGAMKALLAAKVDPNIPSANGKLPLHSVLRMKDDRLMIEAIELLIEAKANPNLAEGRPHELPMTPLHVAIAYNRSDKVIERLMRLGADPTAGEHAAVNLLPPLHILARAGRYALLEAAHMCGYDLNKQDYEGKTCLMHAARGGAVKTIETLLECGVDPTIKDKAGLDAQAHARFAPSEVDFRPLVKAMMRASNDHSLRKELDDLKAEVELLKLAVTGKGTQKQ